MNLSHITFLLLATVFMACASASPSEDTSLPDEVTRPALRSELLEMKEEDQAVRAVIMQMMQAGQANKPPKDLVEEGRRIDAENTERLEEIIEELGGWPGTDVVGRDGADAAWLLAQHADQSPEAQKFFLEKLRLAVEEGKAPPKHYAFLVDRIRLREGKAQLYGTQFDVVGRDLQLKPVAEPEELDERREEMGLEPVEEYLERSKKMLLPASQ